MLELKDITKVYPAGGEHVTALRGISLQFRSNEFVSILGPSGCGKTTLLNIIGGLDQYTDGDLVINGRSTKEYRDRDWDTYRNHSVGFVFQSYNLISHQTVLQNVELALTLSGVSRKERRERARQALIRVGLQDQMKKRPSEMSGGQMQRVAIARAIVNDPDIILADEPTGALDTETSVQVMEILKQIAKDRLVIMVTHNPELAEKYSTRIINILDGRILQDSMPLAPEEAEEARRKDAARQEGALKKPSMSMATAFGLSLKNLFTKKGRTMLTSIAGSIGIIGIALIYSVSNGMTAYIDSVQENTLSSYPLVLEAQHDDLGTLMTTFMGKAQSTSEHADDGVYQKAMLYDMMNALSENQAHENDLGAFKSYLESVRADDSSQDPIKTAVSGVRYSYGNTLTVYTTDPDGNIIVSDTRTLMQGLMGGRQSGMSAMTGSSVMGSSAMWQEMLPGCAGELMSPLLEEQYDLVYGSWPESYDEVLLVVDEDGELSDLTLYALGLIPRANIENLMRAAMTRESVTYDTRGWRYEEICALDFRVILNADCYTLDAASGLYTDLRSTDAGLRYLYDNGLQLRICGVIRPAKNAVATMLSSGVAYTSALTEHLVARGNQSAVVQAQLAAPQTDILTGLPFPGSDAMDTAEKAQAFRSYAGTWSDGEKAEKYTAMKSEPSEELIAQMAADYLSGYSRAQIEALLVQSLSSQMKMDEQTLQTYLASQSDEAVMAMVTQMLTPQITAQYAELAREQLAHSTQAQLAAAFDAGLQQASDETCAAWYDAMMTFSDSTLAKNLKLFGYVDLAVPTSISLYAASFAQKDQIEEAIAAYNAAVGEAGEITYTDYVGLIMSSVTTIINAITYVLIAFVAISLIVSSIMIGVITLISVQERTKEIGILRAIGASKRDVSGMFTAETVLIGLSSGTLGVVVTALLCIPINAILHRLTDIAGLNAFLDIRMALILIAISMLLSWFAGLIPSRSAARKDPVVALRTE